MKRSLLLLAGLAAVVLSIAACNFAPELALEFEILGVSGLNTQDVAIEYRIYNVSSKDLDNCKLEFEITTDEPYGNDYKVWTWGHSIASWSSSTGTLNWSAPDEYIVTGVDLIGAGMDEPAGGE
jgi:hypothetical protein